MDQKTAVSIAKHYIAEIYRDEHVREIGLEEIRKDHHDNWIITIGFKRENISNDDNIFSAMGNNNSRIYKVLEIDSEGNVESMSNR